MFLKTTRKYKMVLSSVNLTSFMAFIRNARIIHQGGNVMLHGWVLFKKLNLSIPNKTQRTTRSSGKLKHIIRAQDPIAKCIYEVYL